MLTSWRYLIPIIIFLHLAICNCSVTGAARLTHQRNAAKRKNKQRQEKDRRGEKYSSDELTSKERTIYRRRDGPGSTEQSLLDELLSDYDSDARGVTNTSDTVTVCIELLLLRIQGLDERSQVLTTTGLLITDWVDHRLKWDPEDYNNLTDIVVRPDRIWLPELALMNGADELSPDFRKIRVLITYTGEVHWEPGGIFMTTCDIDIRYFPFDEQTCIIQFGAWAYYSARMNITNCSHEVMTHDFTLNGEWEIVGTRATWKETILPCCPHTRYPYVEFALFLRRRYAFYIMNIILPCSLLSVLVMIVFCLPPDAGEKISLGISVLLAFTVFLLMVAENVPRTSLHIPVMVGYLTCTMAMGTASVCLTVVVLNLHHTDGDRPVPKLLKIIVLKYIAKILCIRPRRRRPPKPHRFFVDSPDGSISLKSGLRRIARDVGLLKPMLTPNGEASDPKYTGGHPCGDNHGTNHHHQQVFPSAKEPRVDHTFEWKEIARVLDRFFFWLVFVFMTASVLIILLVPLYKERAPKYPG